MMSLVEVRFKKYHRAERLTRSGLLFFLAIVGIGAVAINSGNNLLYLILFFRDCCRLRTFAISRSRSTLQTRSTPVGRRCWQSVFATSVRSRCFSRASTSGWAETLFR
ncbi:MAG: hypothetical protein NTZ77_04830 [Caldiserica bacterium]|nr:hypothetical protein [Caldisericota bacterium]